MGVRKHQRRMAHAKIRKLGIKHPNKPYISASGKKSSFFALNWRKAIGLEEK